MVLLSAAFPDAERFGRQLQKHVFCLPLFRSPGWAALEWDGAGVPAAPTAAAASPVPAPSASGAVVTATTVSAMAPPVSAPAAAPAGTPAAAPAAVRAPVRAPARAAAPAAITGPWARHQGTYTSARPPLAQPGGVSSVRVITQGTPREDEESGSDLDQPEL